jgi:hypothetical protein
MAQVARVGYAVGGAFLDLAFWDLPYYVYAAIGITQYAIRQESAATARAPTRPGGVPPEVIGASVKSHPTA